MWYSEKKINERIGISLSKFMDRKEKLMIEEVAQAMETRELILNEVYEMLKRVIFDPDAIVKVEFDGNTTVVFWKDDTITSIESSNRELGLSQCIVKKICGNDNRYVDIFKTWIPDYKGNTTDNDYLPIPAWE